MIIEDLKNNYPELADFLANLEIRVSKLEDEIKAQKTQKNEAERVG